MRKTNGITKYVIEWQLLRSQVKGNKVNLDDKIDKVISYFEATETYDRWERVYNWMEGLIRGYKSAGSLEKQAYIKSIMESFKSVKPDIKTAIYKDEESELKSLQSLNEIELKCVWKDNFKRTEEYLKKGYHHKEINKFMDWIYLYRPEINELVKERWSMGYLVELRGECSSQGKNKHNFFF